jgi:hypothetical protein
LLCFFFSASWASYASYGYLRSFFFGFTGIIRFLWLLLFLFFRLHGHHTLPMVTIVPFFPASQASYVYFQKKVHLLKLAEMDFNRSLFYMVLLVFGPSVGLTSRPNLLKTSLFPLHQRDDAWLKNTHIAVYPWRPLGEKNFSAWLVV